MLKYQWIFKIQDLPAMQEMAYFLMQNPIGNLIWLVHLKRSHAMQLFPRKNFWTNLLYNWLNTSYRYPTSKNDVLQEIIWFNSNICIANAPIFYKSWFKKGIVTISDIVDTNGEIKGPNQLRDEFCLNTLITLVYGLWQAIPKAWKMHIAEGEGEVQNEDLYVKFKDCGRIANILYRYLSSDSNLLVNSWKKWNNISSVETSMEEYLAVILKINKITISIKFRSFQLRFLYGAIITNVQLKWYEIRNTNLCSFCNVHKETVSHLFIECIAVQRLWNFIENICDKELNIKDILLNSVVPNPKHVENVLVLVTKQFIYRQRC